MTRTTKEDLTRILEWHQKVDEDNTSHKPIITSFRPFSKRYDPPEDKQWTWVLSFDARIQAGREHAETLIDIYETYHVTGVTARADRAMVDSLEHTIATMKITD